MKRFAWEAAVVITLGGLLLLGCDDTSMFHFEDETSHIKPSDCR